MKVYRFEVYAFDLNNDAGKETIKYYLENVKYIYTRVFETGEADVGEWDDDHPLNATSSNIEDFRKYIIE